MPPVAAAITAVVSSIASAVAGATLAITGSAVLAAAAGNLILAIPGFILKTALFAGVSKLLQPKMPAQAVQEAQADVVTLNLGETPREALFGRVATGGGLLDCYNHGTDNEFEVLVIALADHQIDALEGMVVNDQYQAFVGDGVQTGWGGRLQVYFKNGAPGQTATSYLTTTSAGRWTASDVLTGVAYVVAVYQKDEKIWSAGRPRFRWVVRGARLYDPRKDSTVAGGSGAHRFNDPTTFEWSDNAALCRYNFLRGIWSNGQLLVGPGRSALEAPPEQIIAAANICDELVALKAGGTEARYRCAAAIKGDESWLEVDEAFAAAMAGDMIERAGQIVVDPGVAKTVVATFTDDDLITNSPTQVQAKIGRSDLVNSVTATFVDPTKLWETTTAPLRRSLTDITTDGEPRERPLGLRFVTSQTQAQRLAEIERRKARLQRQAVVTLGPKYMMLEVGDWVTWTSARYAAGQSRTFMVTSCAVDEALRITLSLREINANVFAWTAATDELDALAPTYLPPAAPGAAVIAGFNAAAVALTGGGSAVPAINCTWTPPTDPSIYAVTLEWRQVGATDSLKLTYTRPQDGAILIAGGITASTNYEVRITPETDPERTETPSAWRPVTSGSLTTALAAAISGQGALATRNSVQLGAASNLIFAENGTTVLTNATVITAQGVAASITSQGALATLNTVNTPQITTNAVTASNSASSNTFSLIATNAWVTVQTVAITSTGASIDVLGTLSALLSDTSSTCQIEARIVRNGSVVIASAVVAQAVFYASGSPPIYRAVAASAIGGADTPPAGTNTYTLELFATTGGFAPTHAILARSLRALELKR